jgi:hypothetical protein
MQHRLQCRLQYNCARIAVQLLQLYEATSPGICCWRAASLSAAQAAVQHIQSAYNCAQFAVQLLLHP